MIEAIERDAFWVIKNYGSDAGERRDPDSKARNQAKRTAEFVRQWQEVASFIEENHIDLISIESIVTQRLCQDYG